MYMDARNIEVTVVPATKNQLLDKIFSILIVVFIILVCIVLYVIIKRMIAVIENSKKVYHESILKMNTTYGKVKRESEKAAADAKKAWDTNFTNLYKTILEIILFVLIIAFNIYNKFKPLHSSITITTNILLVSAILFEFFSTLLDTFLKNTFHSIDSLEPDIPKINVENGPYKLLPLFITCATCLGSIIYTSLYSDTIIYFFSVLFYILSLCTYGGVPGFNNELFLFIAFFLANIPIAIIVSNRVSQSQSAIASIPLIIAFYIFSIIMLTTMGIADITNANNLYIVMAIIGIAFIVYATTLTQTVYKTFALMMAMIILFMVTFHYIVTQQNWILYMFIYMVLIGIVLYIGYIPMQKVLNNISVGPSQLGTTSYQITSKEIIILCLELLVILSFVYVRTVTKKIYTQNGTLIVNKPIYLQQYSTIKVDKNNDYNYGLSFWVYLTPMNPSSSPQATEYTNILTYGDKPHITYNGYLNTMRVEIKTQDKKKILVDDINPIPLQKWNHILLNYVGGTCDIFVNGELRSSKSDIVPIKNADTIDIGSDNGIHGQVCNLILFHEQLNANQIKSLYNDFAEKTPPTI